MLQFNGDKSEGQNVSGNVQWNKRKSNFLLEEVKEREFESQSIKIDESSPYRKERLNR